MKKSTHDYACVELLAVTIIITLGFSVLEVLTVHYLSSNTSREHLPGISNPYLIGALFCLNVWVIVGYWVLTLVTL